MKTTFFNSLAIVLMAFILLNSSELIAQGETVAKNATVTDGRSAKSETSFGVTLGSRSYYTYKNSNSLGFYFDYTKRSFKKLLGDEGINFIGLGFSLGYQNYRYNYGNGTSSNIHIPSFGVRSELHILEAISFFLENETKLGAVIDPYFSVTPSFRFAYSPQDDYLFESAYFGGYTTAFTTGCRIYKGNFGANIEFGRTGSGGSVKLGVVFRKRTKKES